MLSIIEKTIEAAMPHVLGLDAVEGLPEPDTQAPVDFTAYRFETGAPEFRIVITLTFLALNLFSLLFKGGTFPRLDHSAQAEVLERIFSWNNVLSAAFSYFLFLASAFTYYNRPEVQKLVGFDVLALKEESELRRVTRDGTLPPREGTGPSEGEEAVNTGGDMVSAEAKTQATGQDRAEEVEE